ncbi:phosphatase PAP2 family protein [Phycicoccus endophyticus]|uniref:Phosphatase PAP2 family protein n=1 Tax=Phycicoccus endophyticus TaxID=1690220 RepID=A0A7G9R1B8_9MICO|nr:phosphatase PAP2 family protein [Phycicoccus endophyticus]NHI18829.1 phosphatase PAP2 family protein [Phycicoccus endophyticus]QNN49393.1 phosphatase PAP2 family protein [Phycicoccus endophyticus]GGL36238.1 hypothetical protein GCM10012283_18300 [Phycicoccus endophyticus]
MTSTEAAGSPRSRARRLLRAGLYAVLTAAVLVGVGLLVRGTWSPLVDLDESIVRRLTEVTREHPGLRRPLLAWQSLTQPLGLHLVGTAVCLWVWLARGLRTRAWWAFATLMLAWILGLTAKGLFQRARPVLPDPLEQAPGYSFPSGHAVNSAAWVCVLVLLLWPLVRRPLARSALVVAGAAVVGLTALDRVLLGVHYPTDVTVGVATGAGLALASYAGYRGWSPRDASASPAPQPAGGTHRAVPEESR